ncbi:MAG: RagB/SusD family nutrient uptake outer membrane protein [Bacteroidales bacterium]|nr:RagB/SusD family nutrient uptake outer membrane protein [Bacteroidales bacterium]
MKNIEHIAFLLVWVLAVSSCDLTENQKSDADAALIFGSETGLKTYSYTFYNFLPDVNHVYNRDEMADYLAKAKLDSDYEKGALTPDNNSSWDWTDIRTVNYFLDHNKYETVDVKVRNNYSGIARFFRAWLYFDKLRTYGGVPWIDHVLNPGDPELTAPRDSRDVIIKHIIEDCDYAYENIIAENSSSSGASLVNKYCAMLLKSRACLFEASWRKYHAGTEYVAGCTITADELFSEAAEAADEVIQSKVFSLHTGTANKDGWGPYRELFSSDSVPTDEVMLAVSSDTKLSANNASYYFNKQDIKPSLTRPFMNTYLNIDGSFYKETKDDGKVKSFVEETTDRDYRLNQTIRARDYVCTDTEGKKKLTTANYNYSPTGYHIIKFCVDNMAYFDYSVGYNDIPVMRYAEALLNYAEAKAELGTLEDPDWKITIGALRRRAGITGGDLDSKPTVVDPYLKSTYFPEIDDAVILEIRRERTIELCLEGFRMMDLKRWNKGEIWANAKWTGISISDVDTAIDMNGDGVPDLYYEDRTTAPAEYADIKAALPEKAELLSIPGGKIINYKLDGRVWEDKMYLEPISSSDITMNSNLEQNPGY